MEGLSFDGPVLFLTENRRILVNSAPKFLRWHVDMGNSCNGIGPVQIHFARLFNK
jgi:hypothetical protein